jgi:hypothetical protein
VSGVINSTNITLASQKISGVLGLGFPRLSTISNLLGEKVAPPVLASLAGNGSLAYPLFGLHLERNAIMGGSLTLGALETQKSLFTVLKTALSRHNRSH